jgi:hypothetical protein
MKGKQTPLSLLLIIELLLLAVCCKPANGERRGLRQDHSFEKVKDASSDDRASKKQTKHKAVDDVGSIDELDLGIRFNKVGDEAADLGIYDYPLEMATAKWLRSSTSAVSIVHPDDCMECPSDDEFFTELIESIGGEPTHPTMDPKSPYWQELREVVAVQLRRRNNIVPNAVLPMPNIWDGFDIHEVADAVHDEFPGVHHIALIKEFLSQGATVNRTMVPSPCKNDFVRGVVMLSDINGFAIRTVAPLNFGTKWWVGRARPEEVAWMIYNDELTSEDGVPADIVTDIKSMQLESPSDFTAYPEGSPMHPSWPAMHSAASSASLWLALVLNLTKEQYCEVRKVDYAISYARTVAGVHFPSDNISGLNLGQEILAHYLSKYLSETYEADEDDVKERIKSLRFDWRDFMSSECLEGFVPPVY